MTDKEKIAQLEFIINEIDGALCQYCNEVRDDWEPVSQWDDGCKAAFEGLCDAYNLWHKNHAEVSDIRMKFFLKADRARYELRKIASGHYYHSVERIKEAAKSALED